MCPSRLKSKPSERWSISAGGSKLQRLSQDRSANVGVYMSPPVFPSPRWWYHPPSSINLDLFERRYPMPRGLPAHLNLLLLIHRLSSQIPGPNPSSHFPLTAHLQASHPKFFSSLPCSLLSIPPNYYLTLSSQTLMEGPALISFKNGRKTSMLDTHNYTPGLQPHRFTFRHLGASCAIHQRLLLRFSIPKVLNRTINLSNHHRDYPRSPHDLSLEPTTTVRVFGGRSEFGAIHTYLHHHRTWTQREICCFQKRVWKLVLRTVYQIALWGEAPQRKWGTLRGHVWILSSLDCIKDELNYDPAIRLESI